MTEQAIVTRHLCIRGTVQGVGFRWNMLQAAQDLALAGWVRNRSDGSVEAVVHGPQDAVAAMIHWASNGPA
ncbi:MAG TPA: acylphosphatase, partial [Rhodocyclaceae bacterium]|nr:acylphosphatase [Rhodocyclaceae bacterium]